MYTVPVPVIIVFFRPTFVVKLLEISACFILAEYGLFLKMWNQDFRPTNLQELLNMAEIEVENPPKIPNKSIKFVNKFCFTIYSWNNSFFHFPNDILNYSSQWRVETKLRTLTLTLYSSVRFRGCYVRILSEDRTTYLEKKGYKLL